METEGGEGRLTDCIICSEETELKEDGICLDCQKKVLKALGVNVEFLDEEPYVKVAPKDKEPVYDLMRALSSLASNVHYNYHAINHHSHATKQVEVVNVE